MWRGRYVLLCLLWTIPSLSQTLDQIAGTTVFLYRTAPVIKDGRTGLEIKYATGFLIGVDNNHYFLATADHVANDMKTDFHVIVRVDNDTPVDMTSDHLANTKNLVWVSHEKADVAVARLYPSKEMLDKQLKEHFLPMQIFATDHKAPDRERPLTTLGFPLMLGTSEHFSPISRESKPASGLITLPRFDTGVKATFYLLGDTSIAGFCGAPVFLTAAPFSSATGGLVMPASGTPFQIVGIVHGTIPDDTGGKMAAVTPSMYIVETINKAIGK